MGVITPTVRPLTRMKRTTRSPSFQFAVQHTPYKIQPFCFFPVQPGETLKNLMWQSRAVSDPIKTPLIGAHLEYYWFYQRYTELFSTGTELFTDPDFALAAPANLTTSTKRHLFEYVATGERHYGFIERMYNQVVGHWFREDNLAFSAEVPDANGLFKAQRLRKDVFDSATNNALATETEDFSVDLDANTTITANEVQVALERYERLKDYNLTDMTFEEYLRRSGVQTPPAADLRPELLRYSRDWVYPVNTVNPSTGAPTSAYSWSVMQRADKARFFNNPGFVMGLTICRPKVYIAAQRASFTQALNSMARWLAPGDMDTLATYYTMADTQDLVDHAGTLSVDLRDLWLHGEQFSNIDWATATEAAKWNGVTTDTFAGSKYISDASITAMFVTAGQENIRQDGMVDCEIATRIDDPTPRS